MVTTKDLREMCQNGVTLEDLRKLYGVNTVLEDLELVMPSLLIGNLGILPYTKVATESLSESQQESQDGKEEEVSLGEAGEEEQGPDQGVREEEMGPSEDASEEEVSTSQDEMQEEMSPSQMEKSEGALALVSSMGQQGAREIEPEAPSFYNPLLCTIPWHPLFVLCLLSQTSNMLDVLTGLEILSQLK